MVQTVRSETIPAGGKKIIFEKPLVSYRIFFSIDVLAPLDTWFESRVSFDDPLFLSYYTLTGHTKYFEAKGEGISQGDIWLFNASSGDVLYTMTEIIVSQY